MLGGPDSGPQAVFWTPQAYTIFSTAMSICNHLTVVDAIWIQCKATASMICTKCIVLFTWLAGNNLMMHLTITDYVNCLSIQFITQNWYFRQCLYYFASWMTKLFISIGVIIVSKSRTTIMKYIFHSGCMLSQMSLDTNKHNINRLLKNFNRL